jgi:hypothetical protein
MHDSRIPALARPPTGERAEAVDPRAQRDHPVHPLHRLQAQAIRVRGLLSTTTLMARECSPGNIYVPSDPGNGCAGGASVDSVASMKSFTGFRAGAVVFSVSALVAGAGAGIVSVGAVAAQAATHATHSATPAKSKYVAAGIDDVSVVPHSSKAWALANHSTKTSSSFYALRSHGKKWSSVSIKGAKNGELTAIAAGSTKSIWAVGYSYNKKSVEEPLVERSKGGTFNAMKVKLGSGSLNSVSASSKKNAYAVGTAGDGSLLFAHWNGHKWSKVSTGSAATGLTFSKVSTTASNNAWLLGEGLSGQEVASYNGHHLSAEPLTAPTDAAVTAIATKSAKDVWVVGYQSVTKGTSIKTKSFTSQYNGKKWKKVSTPSPSAMTYLVAVAITGSHAYAAGQGTNSKNTKTVPVALGYSGGHWKNEKVTTHGETSLFTAVSASSKSVVAAGSWYKGVICGTGATPSNPLAETLHGNKWKQDPTPEIRLAVAASASEQAAYRPDC